MRGMWRNKCGNEGNVGSTQDLEIVKLSNKYFSNIIVSFCYQNSVSTAINKFKNHPAYSLLIKT